MLVLDECALLAEIFSFGTGAMLLDCSDDLLRGGYGSGWSDVEAPMQGGMGKALSVVPTVAVRRVEVK